MDGTAIGLVDDHSMATSDILRQPVTVSDDTQRWSSTVAASVRPQTRQRWRQLVGIEYFLTPPTNRTICDLHIRRVRRWLGTACKSRRQFRISLATRPVKAVSSASVNIGYTGRVHICWTRAYPRHRNRWDTSLRRTSSSNDCSGSLIDTSDIARQSEALRRATQRLARSLCKNGHTAHTPHTCALAWCGDVDCCTPQCDT